MRTLDVMWKVADSFDWMKKRSVATHLVSSDSPGTRYEARAYPGDGVLTIFHPATELHFRNCW